MSSPAPSPDLVFIADSPSPLFYPPAPDFDSDSPLSSPNSSPPDSSPHISSPPASYSPHVSSPPYDSFSSSSSSSHVGLIIGIIVGVIVLLVVCFGMYKLLRSAKSMAKKAKALGNVASQLIPLSMVQFFDDMERENPIQFTSQQLRIATNNFSIKLGSGGFGIVYKGIMNTNMHVAVKVLNGTSNQQIEEQFMAEVSIMGRTHHCHLVRLYGFCFESNLVALVYEFMVNGSLDKHLFKENKGEMIGFDKLHEIAVGTAKGIRYLHEECAQRIIHYDIKPGNILLDSNFYAKVADFGLAKLCNRDKTHISMTGGRGTPGYAAPELWMPLPVTHKCDVYSFGMLLFEIIGRRRNMDITLSDSQQWFPIWAWGKYKNNQLEDLMTDCEIEEKDHELLERMLKVALCCVRYRPETRPMMSIIVKMLEGVLEVPDPLNPFTPLFYGDSDFFGQMALNVDGSEPSLSEIVTRSGVLIGKPPTRLNGITIASE